MLLNIRVSSDVTCVDSYTATTILMDSSASNLKSHLLSNITQDLKLLENMVFTCCLNTIQLMDFCTVVQWSLGCQAQQAAHLVSRKLMRLCVNIQGSYGKKM
jgi:DNA polymerase III psi subunit